MKILLAADVHLGRIPVRLMDEGLPATSVSASTAFRSLIQTAIDHAVAAVVIAGDVVDDDRDFYEAYSDLLTGVKQLAAHDIRFIVVAGNHDVHVLPRLASELPHVELLGANGTWEFTTIRAGHHAIDLLGWSFPERTVSESAISGAQRALARSPREHPVFLIAHAALNEHHSVYHPVHERELNDLPLAGWFLGHHHEPGALQERPAGYLGSLAATRQSEQGWRGAWLLEAAAHHALSPVPLSPLRYDTITLDVTDLANDDIEAAIAGALQEFHETHALQAPLVAVGVHLHVVGEHSRQSDLQSALRTTHQPGVALLRHGGIQYFLTAVTWAVRDPYDLTALAAGSDTVAELAKRLLLLDTPNLPDAVALKQRFAERLLQEDALGRRHYDDLAEGVSDAELEGALKEALTLMLGRSIEAQS